MRENNCRIVSFLFIIICLSICNAGFAQDKTVKELKEKATRKIKKPTIDSGEVWKSGGTFSFNIGQGSQSNWSAGGDDFTFSVASYLGLYAFYKNGRYSWDNTIDLNYGLVNTSSQGTRKNDDRIDFLSKVGYELQPKLSLSTLLNFHSQFSKGFNYLDSGRKELLSNFFAPAYVLFSLGLDYKPIEGLSIFVSPITSRWTIVMNDSLSAKGAYGVVPGESFKSEIGAFSSINYLTKIGSLITYNGRLDLFSNYRNNPLNIDVMFNNKFTAKFSKILSASLAVDLIYDDDVKLFGENNDSPAWQFRSLIGVGMNVTL